MVPPPLRWDANRLSQSLVHDTEDLSSSITGWVANVPVIAHWLADHEDYNVCMGTQYALEGLVASGGSYWRPPSRTVEVCQNIWAGSVNYCRLGWYDDVPDVILNGFWSVPEVHTSRPQAWKVRADVGSTKVPIKGGLSTSPTHMSAWSELSEAVKVWVQHGQVRRNRPFLPHQHTHQQPFVRVTRARLDG